MTFAEGIIDCSCDPQAETATLRINFDRARAAGLIGIARRREVVQLMNRDEMDAAATMFTSAERRARHGFERAAARDSLAALRRIASLIAASRRARR
ncbi:hypothetical protein ACN9JG_06180 [Cereibacter azotoformans]|uniref:hypothetical protein n=1 Tax=Cereibacter azotoformans TaxID=43057 RepID=UPI003B21DC8B